MSRINDISESIGKTIKLDEAIEGYYRLGQASIIAIVLKCLQGGKFKITDIGEYIDVFLKDNKQLKEYVYECVKDY